MKTVHKVILLAAIGAFAGAIIGYYQFLTMSPELSEGVIKQLGSIEMLLVVSGLQTALLTAVAAAVGYKLRKRLIFPETKFPESNGIISAVAIGGASSLIITLSEKFIFMKYLPEGFNTFSFSPLYLVAAVLYGGVVEEVLLRLGLMTLILWLLAKGSRRKHEENGIGSNGQVISVSHAWIAIAISSLLFALGHLPATAQMMGLSVPIVIRALLLNGIAGLGFGWLYWKKGLLYAMLGHMMAHIINQLVLMPLLL
ncbi:MAG: CPBP family intramembrane metalloprotease [Acidaminobacter sp.]|uniref:CPBP family intramembrane glutamic endopeptidase n=1 Tax=Acidaminobacter sp. TaxID=1872102 RepID=UPI0013825DFE|nr:CPBP family intramembrane glutamic endopeptidase [Acidaminobacter sp.]MZQ97349.1 CPBP family intramembrane metalloprotease [Acidaminobacter sp.]